MILAHKLCPLLTPQRYLSQSQQKRLRFSGTERFEPTTLSGLHSLDLAQFNRKLPLPKPEILSVNEG